MLNLQAGQRISQYELVEKIGEGGMGVVWKALDTELKRHVAIKFLPRALDPDSDRRIRFKREAQTAAALDHPSIAVIHEVGEHESHPFIVMQLLGGKSLRSLMQSRPLPLEEWARIGIPMAEALAYAHRHGIVHRDLKPDNVMLSSEGQPKIVDFGLAKLFNPEAFDSSDRGRSATLERDLTMVGEVFGTFAYMSPEQARGDRLDHRSDLFSLGVILYEMASGRRPFEAPNPAGTLAAIVSEPHPPLASILPGAHPLAARIVDRALEKDPERRYPSAEDLAEDLRALRAGISGAAISPGPTAEAGAPAGSRARLWLLALVAALTAALAGVLALLPSGGPSSRETEPGSIAVVGFENLSDAADSQNLGRMLMGLVATDLSEAGGLGVASTARVMAARKEVEPGGGFDASRAPEVARAAGARLMIFGQLAQAGDRIVVTAELVDVASGITLHSVKQEAASTGDLFDVAGAVAESVRTHLEVRDRPGAEAFDLAEALTGSAPAYRAYEEGERAFQGQEWQAAAAAFERAVATDPSFALASYRLGMSLTFLGRDEEALAALRGGLDHAERLPARWQTIFRALLQWHEGGIHDAFLSLSRLVSSDPPIPDAYYLLGEIRTHSSRHADGDRARRHFEQARAIDPGFRVVNDHLLDAYLAEGRLEEARRLVERARAGHPEDYFLLESELKILAAEGRWNDLVPRGLEMLASRGGKGFELRTWVIDGWLHLGRWKEALEAADSIVANQTGRAAASALIKRGQALCGQGRLASALESFRASQARADLLVPRIREFGTQGHVYASQILAAAGRLEEASAEARTAVDKDPHAGEGHHLLGRLLVRSGDTIGAAEELGRMRALASTRISPPHAFWEAALQTEIHLASGETAAARAEMDRISTMERAHRDPAAEHRLHARLGLAEGRDLEARKALEAFLALPDSMPGASVVEKTLAILELARIEDSEGSADSARARYREVVDRWGKADMPLEAVAEARGRLSDLQAR